MLMGSIRVIIHSLYMHVQLMFYTAVKVYWFEL